MSLVKVYFLVAMMFSPVGQVIDTSTVQGFSSLNDCRAARTALINEPPAGLPETVGLECIEVEFKVRQASN